MSIVKSFEFKKGIHLFYRYVDNGQIEVLWNKEWVGLESFIKDEYKNLKTYQEKQLLNKQK